MPQFMPQIISANRLTDGLIVFLGPEGKWISDFASAALFESKDAAAAGLAQAQAALEANLVIEVTVIDTIVESGERRAAHLRDAIRIKGPTITPFTDTVPTAPAAAKTGAQPAGDLADVSI